MDARKKKVIIKEWVQHPLKPGIMKGITKANGLAFTLESTLVLCRNLFPCQYVFPLYHRALRGFQTNIFSSRSVSYMTCLLIS